MEEVDSEMDLWVKLDASRSSRQSRNLTVVITVFKKSCSSTDPYYHTCNGTTHCIRKELFCDSHINCLSPEDELSKLAWLTCKEGV